MTRFRRREPPAAEAEARLAVSAAVARLRECQRSGEASVPVADMLRLLGADPETAPAPLAHFRDPQADPVTGCLPVSPGRAEGNGQD